MRKSPQTERAKLILGEGASKERRPPKASHMLGTPSWRRKPPSLVTRKENLDEPKPPVEQDRVDDSSDHLVANPKTRRDCEPTRTQTC